MGRKRSHSIIFWVGRSSFLTPLPAEKMAGRRRHLSMTSSVSILVPAVVEKFLPSHPSGGRIGLLRRVRSNQPWRKLSIDGGIAS